MDPKIWGKPMWESLYNIAYVYPGDSDNYVVERYRNFFESLQDLLPCRMCRLNFKEHIAKEPISGYMKTNKDLVKWLNIIQNEVCKLKGKKEVKFEDKWYELENKKSPTFFTDLWNFYGQIKSIIIIVLVIAFVLPVVIPKIFSFSKFCKVVKIT